MLVQLEGHTHTESALSTRSASASTMVPSVASRFRACAVSRDASELPLPWCTLRSCSVPQSQPPQAFPIPRSPPPQAVYSSAGPHPPGSG